MQQSLHIIREQMTKQVMFHQLARDVLGVLDEPFRASNRSLRNAVFQLLYGRFPTTHANDLRSVI